MLVVAALDEALRALGQIVWKMLLLDDANDVVVDVLPSMLWSLRVLQRNATTPTTTTMNGMAAGETTIKSAQLSYTTVATAPILNSILIVGWMLPWERNH